MKTTRFKVLMRSQRLLIATALIVCMTNVNAQEWFQYNTDNFTVYSDESETKVMEVLHEFEVFRLVALAQLGLPLDVEENQRLLVLMFADGRDLRKTGVDADVFGFYLSSPGDPRMVLRTGSKENSISTRESLFHEYVHHLFKQHSVFIYPRWYMEGMAEVLASAEFAPDHIRIGKPPGNRWNALQGVGALNIERILSFRYDQDKSFIFDARFYASAWLLTHYLQINAIFENKHLAENTRNYLKQFN